MGDSHRAARHGLVFLALALILFAAKLPVLSTPYLWDETMWIGLVHRLADGPLWAALPGLHPPTAFGGRPLGLVATMAVLFKAFGRSIWLSHALAAAFAVLGAFFTYRLADLLYGPTAGVLAALFLAFDATYFAQSGMFLADLPTASLGVACVYLALAGRYAPYFFCAVYLLLVKETAIAVILALCAYVVLRERHAGIDRVLRTALRWGAPLAVIAVYYAAKKLTSGRFFVTGFDFFDPDPWHAVSQVRMVTRWLFLEQRRWLFTGLIVTHLVVAGWSRRRRELLLFALIAVSSGYSFSVIYFLPRYLLPVAPYIFVAAAGALVELVPWRAARLAAAAAILAFAVYRLDDGPRSGTRESNMGYLSVVRAHAAACKYVENGFPSARVLAPWPIYGYLRRPEMGYVIRSVDALGPDSLEDAPRADLVVVDSLPATGREALQRYIRDHGFSLLHGVEDDGVWCGVYGAPTR